jgi:TIR domain
VPASNSHLFICFSSKDETIALGVVDFLEGQGLKCWISSRDVPPGQNYQETIVNALETARGIVFLFSESSNKSGEIKKELSIAASIEAPVFPLRLSPIAPVGALRYELATRQWIDLFPDREQALTRLTETIRKVFGGGAGAQGARDATGQSIAEAAAQVATSAPAAAGKPKKKPKAKAPLLAADSREFEATRALLAKHIGPIARILVQKAAVEARSVDEFCERLAAHVRAPDERAAFLQAARAQLKP